MARRLGWLSTTAILLTCVVYQWLVHSAIIEARSEGVRLALMAAPLAAFACWIAMRARHKTRWSLALLACAAALFLLEHHERWGIAAAYGVAHATAYLFLLWLFARTLARGAEPLITRLARRVHGTLPPAMQVYTRRLTIAWCVFFGAQVLISGLLFVLAPLDTWSLFVNVLNLPLLVLMFAAEYGYRVTRHRDFPHATFTKSIEAFAADRAFAENAEVR